MPPCDNIKTKEIPYSKTANTNKVLGSMYFSGVVDLLTLALIPRWLSDYNF